MSYFIHRTIRIADLGKFEARLARETPAAFERFHETMARRVLLIMQQETRRQKAVFRGRLIRSWRISRGQRRAEMLIRNIAPYADVVDGGRRPNSRMPPSSVLVPWIQQRFGVSRKQAQRLAYPVARAIARKGIRPRRIVENGAAEVRRVYDHALRGMWDAHVRRAAR